MTEFDYELIEDACSTTYRSSIYKLIDQADTEECRQKLMDILNDREIEWED